MPSQVGVLFAGCGHATHDVVPQLATLVFSTHVVPHMCAPPAQEKLHVPPEQVGLVFAGPGEQSLLVQQAAFAMQAAPHSLKPVAQVLALAPPMPAVLPLAPPMPAVLPLAPPMPAVLPLAPPMPAVLPLAPPMPALPPSPSVGTPLPGTPPLPPAAAPP